MKKTILKHISEINIFDGHEHFISPEERCKEKTGFFELLDYIKSDFNTSGLDIVCFEKTKDMDKKIELFLSAYENSFNTSYCRLIPIIAKDLFNIDKIDFENIKKLDEKIKEKSKNIESIENWNNFILTKKCRIIKSLTVYDGHYLGNEIMKPIIYLDFLMQKDQVDKVRSKFKEIGKKLSFKDYLEYVDDFLERMKNINIVAGKFGTPYWRSLEFLDSNFDLAEKDFSSSEINKPYFEGFVYEYLLSWFEKNNLPVQFHTGHIEPLSANLNHYQGRWSNPFEFGKVASKFRNLKIILLHSGFPFSEEYFSLAKNHKNIYCDFSWIYIVSESVAMRNLNMALDMIPNNKIIGFGGDFGHVESIYAHLEIAKKVITNVFVEKIENGNLNLDQSLKIINKIMYENPNKIYGFERME